MLAEFWHYFSENRGAVIGLVVFVLLVLAAIFAPLIAPHPPNAAVPRCDPAAARAGRKAARAAFLLGTDAVGRDILSRLLYGARFSLFIGVVVVTIALTSGIVARPDRRLLPRLDRHRHHADRWTSSSRSRRCCWRWSSSPCSGPG